VNYVTRKNALETTIIPQNNINNFNMCVLCVCMCACVCVSGWQVVQQPCACSWRKISFMWLGLATLRLCLSATENPLNLSLHINPKMRCAFALYVFIITYRMNGPLHSALSEMRIDFGNR